MNRKGIAKTQVDRGIFFNLLGAFVSGTSNTESERQIQHSAQMIELPELRQQSATGPAVLGANLHLLKDVQVKLNAVIGSVHTTLGELMDLKETSVLKIDRQIDCPIDVLLGDQVVARGQLVAIDDNFGVRITEVASTTQS